MNLQVLKRRLGQAVFLVVRSRAAAVAHIDLDRDFEQLKCVFGVVSVLMSVDELVFWCDFESHDETAEVKWDYYTTPRI